MMKLPGFTLHSQYKTTGKRTPIYSDTVQPGRAIADGRIGDIAPSAMLIRKVLFISIELYGRTLRYVQSECHLLVALR